MIYVNIQVSFATEDTAKMKKVIFEIFLIMGCFYGQTENGDVKLYYFFAQQDTVELKAELNQKGMAYKPMFIILDKDTVEVTQINAMDQPYRNTKPMRICSGVPDYTEYTPKGVYIHLKKYQKVE